MLAISRRAAADRHQPAIRSARSPEPEPRQLDRRGRTSRPSSSSTASSFDLRPTDDDSAAQGRLVEGRARARCDDGVRRRVRRRTSGGLTLTIRGLAPGKHSLVTYHNSLWDADLGPIDVIVDGKPAVSDVQPSRRVDERRRCGERVRRIRSRGRERRGRRNPTARDCDDDDQPARVVLNGLELDTVDPTKKAVKPSPLAGDEHVAEQPTLAWQAAKVGDRPRRLSWHRCGRRRRRHARIARISRPPDQNRSSPADVADPSATYYWRVDEVHGEAPRRRSPRATSGPSACATSRSRRRRLRPLRPRRPRRPRHQSHQSQRQRPRQPARGRRSRRAAHRRLRRRRPDHAQNRSWSSAIRISRSPARPRPAKASASRNYNLGMLRHARRHRPLHPRAARQHRRRHARRHGHGQHRPLDHRPLLDQLDAGRSVQLARREEHHACSAR